MTQERLESDSEGFNDQSTKDYLDLGYVSGVRLGFLFRTGLYLETTEVSTPKPSADK